MSTSLEGTSSYIITELTEDLTCPVIPHSYFLICHRKNVPGKNGLSGPILDEKMVRTDHSYLTKNGPAGLILVTKITLTKNGLVSRAQH